MVVGDGYPSCISNRANRKPPASQHLFIRNLSQEVEMHELLHLFSQYGDVDSIGFKKGRSFNFISYTTVEAAIVAVGQLDKSLLHGFPMAVQFKKPNVVAGVAAGNVKVGFSKGLERLELKGVPPSKCRSQDLTHSAMIMYPDKRIKHDSLPKNVGSGRLAILPSTKPAVLDYSKKYIWEGIVVKGGVSLFSARCFSIQRTIDVVLPQHLNFALKLDLKILRDRLFYPGLVVVNVGVVCFEPASLKDAENYCKLRSYLYQQNKAAVAKLNENDYLIIVPPPSISESVLNAPDRFNIVGFIDRVKKPNLKTGIAVNKAVRAHMRPKEIQGEMMPSQSETIKIEPRLAATYLSTLCLAAEILWSRCRYEEPTH